MNHSTFSELKTAHSIRQTSILILLSDGAKEEVWKPFSMIDSVAIEDAFEGGDSDTPVPTEGGRFDVSIKDRTKNAVFWKDDFPCPIRRCSWFYQSNVDGR